jgi:hypothetical protein
MGIEVMAFLILEQVAAFSRFLEQNAGLILGTSLFFILSATGAITLVRRWRSE